MRQQFIPTADADNRDQAENLAPWAAVVVRVDGGWMAFESQADCDIWMAQV